MRVRFRVQGLVQGVGFRWWTRDQAQRLGLSGWVRNEADGAVSGLAEGGEDALASFRDLLARGPAHAEVSALHLDLDRDGGGEGESLPLPFEIRR